MQYLITETTLAKAISTPWSTTTCLVATAIQELTGSEVLKCTSEFATTSDRQKLYHNGRQLQLQFDRVDFHGCDSNFNKVITMLPFMLEVSPQAPKE